MRRLAERLRAAGLRVWFDESAIQPGDGPSPVGRERVAEGRVRDRELAIERGLEASRTLVLCLSPAALGSGWVRMERSTVVFRDPDNAERRFIPLLLADCKLPDALRRATPQARSSSAANVVLTRGRKPPGKDFKRPWLPLIKMDAVVKAKASALLGNDRDNPRGQSYLATVEHEITP